MIILIELIFGALALTGGYYVLKGVTRKEVKKENQLEQIKDDVEDMVEEDFTELKRNDLVNKIIHHKFVGARHQEFKQRLIKSHKHFNEIDFKHPRAHTFYNTLLPKLLQTKDTQLELATHSDKKIDTKEMYDSLIVWMDEIIENKISKLETEAEINAEVITLLTK